MLFCSTAFCRGVLGVALWLTASAPVALGDELSDKAAQQAREECRELLQDKGFKNIDFGDMRSRDDGDKVVVEVEAKRKGNERDVTCTYDREEEKAELD